jgi:adenine-specific DNA-methyltransferase
LASWVILSPLESRIKNKIEEIGVPLKKWDIQINRGILTGYNEAFIITTELKEELIRKSSKNAELIRPIFRGRDVKRYLAKFAGQWIINSHNGTKEKNVDPVDVKKDYPVLFEHLSKYKKELELRLDKGKHWSNLRNCAYLEELKKEKIIWIELTDHPNFYLDIEGYYINNTVFFMTGDRLPYILTFLNSKLCEWYFTKIATTSGAGTRRWIKIYVDQICIPEGPSKNAEDKLSLLGTQVQKQKLQGKDTSVLEKEIDMEIFNLFNLTNEEISFIEHSLL